MKIANRRARMVFGVTDADLWMTLVGTLVGSALGWGTSYYFYQRGGAPRPRLNIGLRQIAYIDPSILGIQLEMKIGTTKTSNLLLLEVSVTNRSRTDVVVADAANEDQHPWRPRIVLPTDLRSLADPWLLDGMTPESDVRLARKLVDGRQVLYVHIHRLAAGRTSRSRIICAYRGEGSMPELHSDALEFYPGFLPNVRIERTDMLRAPTMQLDR